jgi:hypothetical protein
MLFRILGWGGAEKSQKKNPIQNDLMIRKGRVVGSQK